MFRSLLRKAPKLPNTPSPQPEEKKITHEGEIALILGHFCLAHQGSFCSTCVERCPVPGAMSSEAGKPIVHPDVCTGCGICHGVCPAPKNAIFFVAKSPKQGMIGKTVTESKPDTTENDPADV